MRGELERLRRRRVFSRRVGLKEDEEHRPAPRQVEPTVSPVGSPGVTRPREWGGEKSVPSSLRPRGAGGATQRRRREEETPPPRVTFPGIGGVKEAAKRARVFGFSSRCCWRLQCGVLVVAAACLGPSSASYVAEGAGGSRRGRTMQVKKKRESNRSSGNMLEGAAGPRKSSSCFSNIKIFLIAECALMLAQGTVGAYLVSCTLLGPPGAGGGAGEGACFPAKTSPRKHTCCVISLVLIMSTNHGTKSTHVLSL